jgi:hypothetical protein
LKSGGDEDVAKAITNSKTLRLYTLSQASKKIRELRQRSHGDLLVALYNGAELKLRSDFKSVYGKDWPTTGSTGVTGMKKVSNNPSFSLPHDPRAPRGSSVHAIEIRSRRSYRQKVEASLGQSL